MNGDAHINDFPLPPSKPSNGPLLGTIIIIILIVIGGIYISLNYLNREKPIDLPAQPNNSDGQFTTSPESEALDQENL
ncbi:MAG: hypothetical protein AAB505_00865 [Patescibacteria group bacterium]